jgi:hypothetical protein
MAYSICGLPISLPNPRSFFEPIVNGTTRVLQAARVFEFAEYASARLRALMERVSTLFNDSKETLLFIGVSAAVALAEPAKFFGACGVGMAANLVLGSVMRGHQVSLFSESMGEATVAQAALAAVHITCRAIQSTNAHAFPSAFREGAVSSMLSGLWAGFVLTDIIRRLSTLLWRPAPPRI